MKMYLYKYLAKLGFAFQIKYILTTKPHGKQPRGTQTSLGHDFELPKKYLR